MIIINRKRIALMFIVLIVSVISFNLKQDEKNIVETSSLPSTNKVIILDAGHGKPDEGNWKLTQDIKQLIFAVK